VKAISIRAPWWYFILHTPAPFCKDVENREWPAPRELVGKNILIHAAKGGSRREFEEACEFALKKCGVLLLPNFETIERGGIVGMVKLRGCVRTSSSPWFTGKFGHLLGNPYPMRFAPLVGQTGYFDAVYDPPNKTKL
jgi:hypothetical protein